MEQDTPLVVPEMWGRRLPNLNKRAVLLFSTMDIRLAEKAGKINRSDRTWFFNTGLFMVKAENENLPVLGPAVGAPVASMVLELMICKGVKEIIAVGSCGSLQPDIYAGDVLIPTYALSEEGTSPHYPNYIETPYASEMIVGCMEDMCKKNDIPYHKGGVWTTDAVFRETAEKVQRYQNKGLLAVEMEMSALFTIGNFRGVNVGGIMVVSDELGTLQWKPGSLPDAYPNSMVNLFKALLV